ncbi:hypothetical protein FLM55_05000 [Francisella sp. Scap27]|uniref:arginine deiminase-related protein n=1 Tax=Francisella sp. Scap27 TaxID=2589986 RepID=UPI0015B7D741|nr:arginine deiminase-related protein [Francisella sp. Scap27]QLE79129.1 hypothetical protein FLM55_05000 [Francisella sp. Scap27]
MHEQVSDTVLMVEPNNFGFNQECYEDNSFQQESSLNSQTLQAMAKDEFYEMINYLRSRNINIIIMKSDSDSPDAVFVNDWLSTHKIDGKHYLFVYPLLSAIRRAEVEPQKLKNLLKEKLGLDYKIKDFRGDFSRHLEGNAAMVFDKTHKKIFLSLSRRGDKELAQKVADELGFDLITFTALDHKNKPIYQTTQILSIGEKLIFVCLESIKCEKERDIVAKALQDSGKTIIDLSKKQISLRCCNNLEVKNAQGRSFLILSATANMGLTENQTQMIDQYCERLACSVKTIEDVGGGTARCMVSEIIK